MKKTILLSVCLLVATSAVWALAPLKKYEEITMLDTQGKEVKLSEVIQSNKYTLLDFWASWCGPCRAELPYLKEAYKTYKDKGFEIYAVTYDRTVDAWKACIEKEQMPWIHVSRLEMPESAPTGLAVYDVKSIPASFLFDAQGNVVATSLRGEQLAAKLKELFDERW